MKNTNFLLIWDIDGTLIQGRGLGKKAMNRAFLELYGVSDGFEHIDMAGRLDALILKAALKTHNITKPVSEYFFYTYCKHLQDELDNLSIDIAAPGILDLLSGLAEKKNFFSVLGTGNIEKGARIKLSKHDMNKYFLTGGFGEKEVERWQIIQDAVNKSKSLFNIEFSHENIYVIGDTPLDIECGKTLGVKTVGVATGRYTEQDLLNHNPEHVFNNLIDIDTFLRIFDV